MATARWYEKMKRKRLKTNRNILPGNIKKNTQGPSFTQEQYDFEDCILPVNDKTFWRILKDEGIKYSTHSKPYICPVCAEGPVNAVLRENIDKDLAEIAGLQETASCKPIPLNDTAEAQVWNKLQQRQQELVCERDLLDFSLREYERHLEQ